MRLGLRASVAALAIAGILAALAVAVGPGRTHAARVAATHAVPGSAPTGQASGVLAATITPDPALVHDGDGVVSIALADVSSADLLLRRVRATVRLPAPARAIGLANVAGWRCRIQGGGHEVSCTLTSVVARSSSLAAFDITVGRGGRSFGSARLQVRGTWVQPGPNGRLRPQASTASLVVDERAPLSVEARSAEKAVIEPVGGLPTTPTILQGTVGRRTPEPISFSWRQLCGHGPCARVRWASSTNGLVLDGQQPVVSFTPPKVKRPQLLRFALTASDPRGAVTAVTAVRVVPDQIEHIDPTRAGAAFARASLHTNTRPVTTLPLTKADRASVSVGAPGAYRTRVNALVRLDARVQGQRVSRTSWTVSVGPRSLLARARRSRAAISFRAPAVPGTYAIRMTAITAAGRFSRDELIEVNPVVRRSADVASAGPERQRVFCADVTAARERGRISISLPSGGTFTAETNRPLGHQCSGTEKIEVTGGSTALGSFELNGVHGTITRDRGLLIAGGILMAPGFWGATPQSAADKNVHAIHGTLAARAAQAGPGLAIPFQVPRTGDVSVGLEIPLTDGGFGDLAGGVTVNEGALAKFPLSRSLPDSEKQGSPDAWKMTHIGLSVVPAARRFELTADARGPSSIGGEVSFYGVLTFDGQVSASLSVSNLAVFQSADGQKVPNTVQGTLTLLPARRFDPANPNATGSYFPLIDVQVSAEVKNYRPAENVSLSGRVSWSSNGPLEVEGTLDTAMKGTPVRFTVTGSFTDANNWTLYSRFDGGENGLPIGSPQLLKLKLLEGTLSRHGGKLRISVKGEASEIRVIEGVAVPSAKIEFTTGCSFNGEQNAPEDRMCLLVELKSELTFPDRPSLKVGGAVKVDFTTGRFEVSGHVALSPNDPIGKTLGLHDVNMFVTNAGPPRDAVCKSVVRPAAAGGLYFGITGKGKVRGLDVEFHGAYLGKTHFCLGATIGSASLPTGSSDTLAPGVGPPKEGQTPPEASCAADNARTLQNLTFAYSSDTGEGQFSGKFCFPSGVRKELGAVGTGVGSVSLYLSKSGGFAGEASYKLPGVVWFLNAKNQSTPDPAKAALGFKELTVSVKAGPATGLILSFTAHGELSLPAPTGASGGTGKPTKPVPISLGVDVTLGLAPSLSIAANVGQSTGNQPCSAANAKIHNAFDAKGFDICQFGFAGSVGLGGFSVSVNASFKLPDKWGPELGVHNASLKIGFKISPKEPCLNLEIDKAQSSGRAAIDLLNKGAIVANSAALRIAPAGCSLPDGTRLDPGISLKFDGTLFGTATSVDLKIARKDPGLKVDFTLRTGASSLGPLKFGATNIRVLLDPPQAQLELHTSIRIGDHGGVKIDGSFSHSGQSTTLKASACLLGNLPPIPAPNTPAGQPPPCGEVNLLGARFKGNVNLDFQSSPLKAEFSGEIKADLKLFDLNVKVNSLLYDSTNTRRPGLQKLDIKVNTGFNLGSVAGRIEGSVDYSADKQEIALGLSGHVKIWKFEASFSLPAKFSTDLRLPFSFGPGKDTTRISEPKTLLVLRLSGKLDGKVGQGGSVAVTHVLPIEGCFPFETVCVKIGDAKVNTDTGTVSFKVFGRDVVIDASKYVKSTPGQVDYSPGISYLINKNSGKCVDVPFANFTAGKPLQQIPCHATRHPAQEFKLLSDGTLRVRSGAGHEFCVSAESGAATLASCARKGQVHDVWYRDTQGRIHGIDGRGVHGCLDVAGQSKDNSALIRLEPCNDGQSQRWVMAGGLRLPGMGCLDVPNGSLTSDLKVFPNCNGTANQAFALYPNGELQVRGLCVTASANRSGAAVKLADCNGSREQLWFLHYGKVCIGKLGRFGPDVADSQCLTTDRKEGDFFPVRLAGSSRADTYLWDLTY